MSGLRESFVARFNEAEAAAIEAAANGHKNGIHDRPGSDPFRWALLICIGYDCMTRFAESHGISIPFSEIDAWMMEHTADFSAHDGDSDFISLFCGTYDKYVGKTKDVTA